MLMSIDRNCDIDKLTVFYKFLRSKLEPVPKLLIVKKGAGAKQKFFVTQGAGAKQYRMCLIVKNCKIDNGQIILVNLFSI